ncbi:hypothetical protein CsSME_00026145 [Camellia sinensis var. sinensis]
MSIERTLVAAYDLFSAILSPKHQVTHALSHSCNNNNNVFFNQVLLQHTASTTANSQRRCIVVDGSWLSMNDHTGLAWVCFDECNHLVQQIAVVGPSLLSLQQTEAESVLQALRWALKQGIMHLHLQTDCRVVVLLCYKIMAEPLTGIFSPF